MTEKEKKWKKQQLFAVLLKSFLFNIYFIFVVKEIMDDDENDTNHSHSIEPTIMIAQRNDEVV